MGTHHGGDRFGAAGIPTVGAHQDVEKNQVGGYRMGNPAMSRHLWAKQQPSLAGPVLQREAPPLPHGIP